MRLTTAKKVDTASCRPTTVSRRAVVLTALILVVLAALVPAQVMAQNAIPTVNQPLVPTAAAPGGAAFTLTVNGTGFVSGAVVNWNGSARVTTFVTSQQVTAAILATDIATAQTATVTVTNPAPGGGTSLPILFPVTKATTGTFMARNDISVNPTVMAVASGDFRGNGKTDLALANSANSIDVLLGNGDGTFAAAVNYPISSGFPVAIIVGDFNGDGKPDLAVLLGHTKQVLILLGKGDGTFTTGQEFPTGVNPASLAAADVNNDGKLDLLVANYNDNTVSVLLGNGDGTFQTQVPYATGVNPQNVAVGDFNGDGLLDLAVANNNDNTVSILLGAGSGTFSTHVDYKTAGAPTWVATADFNRDGKLDLAVCTASGNMSILLGSGTGTFGAPTNFKIGANAQMVVVGDFTGNGFLDLADVNFGGNSASILQGLGNGTFKSQEIYPTNLNPGWLTVGDFNNDGRPDLAVVDTSGSAVSILTQSLLTVSPTFVNYPVTQGGFPAKTATVTLRNNSKAAIGITNVAITGANPGDFSQTNTCGSSIGAGKTCTFSIIFTPQYLGSRSAQIIITETNGSTVGISAFGTGVITVSIGPNPHAFPTTLLGKSSPLFKALFKNDSKLTVTLTSLLLTGLDTGDFVISNNNCSSLSVGPLGSCTLDVAFKPTTTGSRTAALTVFGDFSPGNGQQAILLSGIGTAVSVTPTTLTFAAQTVGTTSSQQVVTVKNVGNPALPVTVSIQGTDFKDFAQTNNCTPSIAPGASCTINVTFTPQATGARTAAVYIGDSDPTGPQIVNLSGTGQ